MGSINDGIFYVISSSCLGKKRFLTILIKEKIMLGEILTVGATCFAITIFGLALGFVFLQVQANT